MRGRCYGLSGLVPRTLGDRTVLPDPERRLPHRSPATGPSRAHRDSAGDVHGRCLADQPADATGPQPARTAGGSAIRKRRVAGSLCAEKEEAAQGGAAVEHRDAPDSATQRLLARKGDGEPGAKTLWLGMRDIAVFVQGLRFARMTL